MTEPTTQGARAIQHSGFERCPIAQPAPTPACAPVPHAAVADTSAVKSLGGALVGNAAASACSAVTPHAVPARARGKCGNWRNAFLRCEGVRDVLEVLHMGEASGGSTEKHCEYVNLERLCCKWSRAMRWGDVEIALCVLLYAVCR